MVFFVIKPGLTYRLKHLSDSDYNAWFIVNHDPLSIKIHRDLSIFVREKYLKMEQAQKRQCLTYLHVFAHTTEGKALAIVFDAKDDRVIQMRYLDDSISPTNWRYRQHIEKTCIENIDKWQAYFVNIIAHNTDAVNQYNPLTIKAQTENKSKLRQWSTLDKELMDEVAPGSSVLKGLPLKTLALRYQYDILYQTRTTQGDEKKLYFIVIRFTDIIQSRSWDFELTAINWNILRSYTDNMNMDNNNNHSIYDAAIKRLIQIMPIAWLTRQEEKPISDVIGNAINKPISNHENPCWREEYGRAALGKRPVTLHSFYTHYLHGLELPSTNEYRSKSIRETLAKLYFDCVYDKAIGSAGAHQDGSQSSMNTLNGPSFSDSGIISDHNNARPQLTSKLDGTPDKNSIDAILYPIVPILRICEKNKYFDSLLQRCQ